MRWKPARIWSIVMTKLLEKGGLKKLAKENNLIWPIVMTKLLESGGLEKMGRRPKGKTLLLNLLMRPSEETGQQLAHGLFGFLMNTFNDHVDGLKHQLMVEVRHLYVIYFNHLGDISESNK